ncbi:GH18169 [Drosophila grimshawi]|uniref:GH18169 n=1 Tax=Drosophila grimshawi TaxID=7222 RepID=B4JG67_DROGR|nr:GH18169 [Drosophila grimshawi]
MSQSSSKVGFIGLTLLCLLSCVASYNYMVVLPCAARSHYNVGSALAKGLAAAGHQVTLVSPFALKKPIKNINDLPVPSILKAMSGDIGNLLKTSEASIIQQILGLYDMGIRRTGVLLSDSSVIELMQSNQTFDAVICEVFLNEAQFGLAEHFNAPLIGMGTFGAISWNTDLVGTPSPPSYVPHPLLKFSDHMSLVQRVINLAFLSYEYLFMELYYLPQQEQLYTKYFPNNKQNFYDMRKNTALMLLNQHVSLSFPRPYSPNMIEVGGMHINRKRQPLPQDIEEFIKGAQHGVIYFSMGSNLKSKDLPQQKRLELIKTFSKLKQRVLWKFEEPNLPGKPENVFISDWFPQDDILAHENVILFITHGGLLSTTESIYHGKPFVGIPMFGDQFLNMERAEQNGYGRSLVYEQLSAERLLAAIQQLIEDPKANDLVKAMSARYKDQPQLPLERAVYWVEHVTRHGGARYLRSASQDLNFVQYHNLDAILILYGGILFFVLYCIALLICCAWRALQNFFMGRKTSQDKMKQH